MAAVKELLRAEENGTLSFGDFELEAKTKKADFEYQGDLYKVKTFREITKLERNGMLVYESDPGTAVHEFAQSGGKTSFELETPEDAQIILGLAEDADYRVTIDGADCGIVHTGMGGKLVLSVEASDGRSVRVLVEKQ